MLALLVGGAILLGGALWLRRGARRIERASDARFPRGSAGVVVGAETIDLPIGTAGAPAVLLLHGGGDTPQTLRYLAGFLHARGYAVRAPLLPGHGRTLRDFARVSASGWTEAARAEYGVLREQHDWVAIVGLSMGGALAVQLAAESVELPALGLLAPYLSMPPSIAFAARFARLWGLIVPYVSAGVSAARPSIQDEQERIQSLSYGVFAARALRALRETVRRADAALPRVAAPTLMIQSRQDNRISERNGQRAFDRLGASEKRLVWTEGAGHVITVDRGREHVFELVREWLDTHRQRRQAIA
ncbi:MAG TPA: alpha/beta fold hydrolase [Gemmatimonadaceae bacterium]|nr:alpha/beta fold hydrolase [Gemmatimonadaceae bacterium]